MAPVFGEKCLDADAACHGSSCANIRLHERDAAAWSTLKSFMAGKCEQPCSCPGVRCAPLPRDVACIGRMLRIVALTFTKAWLSWAKHEAVSALEQLEELRLLEASMPDSYLDSIPFLKHLHTLEVTGIP